METGFLGTGWKFPPTFDLRTRSVQMVSNDEDVRESLYLLLSTQPGERIMMPDFGCNLKQMAFEPLDSALLNRMVAIITDAIEKHEPRVMLDNVSVLPDLEDYGRVMITFDYTILANNTRYNFIFPYYLQDARPGEATVYPALPAD